MFTRLGTMAAALIVVGSVAAAPGGGRGGAGGGNSGGSISRGTSSGGRTIVAGAFGFGASSSNNFGGGAYYGGFGGRRGGFGYGGFGSSNYGNVGFGGLGVPLMYGAGNYAPPPVVELVPPPPLPPPVTLASGPGTIAFNIPENALVWVNNNLLDQTGSERDFTTPALSPGAFGSFRVLVKWTENGEEKSFSQRVTVRAGSRASVTIFGRSDKK